MAVVLFYVYYTQPDDCTEHKVFISLNLIFCVIISFVSILPKIQVQCGPVHTNADTFKNILFPVLVFFEINLRTVRGFLEWINGEIPALLCGVDRESRGFPKCWVQCSKNSTRQRLYLLKLFM